MRGPPAPHPFAPVIPDMGATSTETAMEWAASENRRPIS